MEQSKSEIPPLRKVANALGEKLNADLLIYNYEITPPIDFLFVQMVAKRRPRQNVILFLATEGGLADSAFRMMRILQSRYTKISIVVAGWCKSAGTLMCIGGHELIIGSGGELGPLDVQIVKADEMDEQKSGLVAEAAFEKLQQEAFKFFMGFVKDVGASDYRVTLKTAFDIAQKMTVGVIAPIVEKLEPVTIGEDYRSNRLALAYAERLNLHSSNLKRTRDFNPLQNLLSGYPSHGFVVDQKEARELFKNVQPLSGEIVDVVDLLGADARFPRSRRSEQSPRLEFLNDELPEPTVKPKAEATQGAANDGSVQPQRRRRRRQLPGSPETGSVESPSGSGNGAS